MRIRTVVICLFVMLLACSCSHRGSIEAQRVERVAPVHSSPLVSPISQNTVIRTSIAKPRPTDRGYTAPYPKLGTAIVAKPAVSSSAYVTTDPNVVKRTSLITTTTRIDPSRATTTEEFLSGGAKTTTVVTPISTEYGANVAGSDGASADEAYDPAKHPVLEKAMALPPKQIEEGRYRTFRGVENDIAYDTRKIRGKVAEFLFPEMNDIVEKPKGVPQNATYCYKSMGDSTCYSKPIPGQDFRLIGKTDARF